MCFDHKSHEQNLFLIAEKEEKLAQQVDRMYEQAFENYCNAVVDEAIRKMRLKNAQ